jgi:hypothetical protein
MATNRPRFESLDEMAAATASALSEAASHEAFALFSDKKFRALARFESIPQVEHDRIFNELVVAWLMLIRLTLEAPDLRADSDLKPFLSLVSAKIAPAYVSTLAELGVANTHCREWETLLEMRYDEYARDRHAARAAAIELESAEKELTLDDLRRLQLFVPVSTVAIGCHHHICRGETEGRDELFKAILRPLARFYVESRLRFEGATPSPLTKMRAALRRLLGDK